MKLRVCKSLLLLLTLTWSTSAQTAQLSSAGKGNAARQTRPISATYGDTLKMLKTWLESEKNVDLAGLFTMGDARASDLLAACHSTNDKIASAAFFMLRLLGRSESVDCGNSISRKHKRLAFPSGSNFTNVDFNRIEEWLAKKRAEKEYECGDDSEPIEPADSLVYELVLDGSPRSKSILDRLLAIDKACAWENTISDPLEQAQSLIVAAREIGHNMRFEPDTLGSVMRDSAFFLPSEHRKESRVEVIARNKTGDHILLEISYRCGLECGRGYYVVLQKDGNTWQYALITMAWIS
ncbi:MAG: hypothetical protein DMG36_03480 [Acidobacteria bacterium]|nr:MAG: hypothetical protein DMG36_03480 [Acidobacteriota bacterium]